jgi:hypothetical protein
MADIIPPGFMEVIIPHKHALLAREALVTFAVQLTDVGDVAAVNEAMDKYRLAFQSSMDNQVTVGPAEGRVGQDGGENLVVPGTTTWTGAVAAADSVNGGQALLVHKRTNRGGRRGRGRMYIPWVLQDNVVGETGVILPATVTAFNTVVEAFRTAIAASGYFDGLYLLHSPSGPGVVNPTPTGSPNAITSLSVDTIIGTQRRRLGRK